MARQKKIYDDIHSDKDMQAMIKNINATLSSYYTQLGDDSFYQARKGMVESLIDEQYLKSEDGKPLQIKNVKDLRADAKTMQSLVGLQSMLSVTELKKKFQKRLKENDDIEVSLRSKALVGYMNTIITLEQFTKDNITYLYESDAYKPAIQILQTKGRQKTYAELKEVEDYLTQAIAAHGKYYSERKANVRKVLLNENTEVSPYFG